MCECGDYEPPEFLRERTLKATKSHECCECLRVIQPGETYRSSSGKWDGLFTTFKTCLGCLDFAARAGVTCWCFGMLMDEFDALETDSAEVSDWLEARQRRWREIEAGRVAIRSVSDDSG